MSDQLANVALIQSSSDRVDAFEAELLHFLFIQLGLPLLVKEAASIGGGVV